MIAGKPNQQVFINQKYLKVYNMVNLDKVVDTIIVDTDGRIITEHLNQATQVYTYISGDLITYIGNNNKVYKPVIKLPYNAYIMKALTLAKLAHTNQKYGEKDYFSYHIVNVITRVKTALELENYTEEHKLNIIITSILHDVVEDSGFNIEIIKNIFNEEVYNAVKAITYLKGTESRDAYYNRVLNNNIATFVKLHDAYENSHNCYLEHNVQRAERYQRLIQMLKIRKLSEKPDIHQKVLDLINKVTQDIKTTINDIPEDENSDVIKTTIIELWSEYHSQLYLSIFMNGDACANALLNTIKNTADNKQYNPNIFEKGSSKYNSYVGLEQARVCIHNAITKFLKKV